MEISYSTEILEFWNFKNSMKMLRKRKFIGYFLGYLFIGYLFIFKIFENTWNKIGFIGRKKKNVNSYIKKTQYLQRKSVTRSNKKCIVWKKKRYFKLQKYRIIYMLIIITYKIDDICRIFFKCKAKHCSYECNLKKK